MSVRSFELKSPLNRAALAAAVIVVIAAAYFAAKWSFANMGSLRVDDPEVAKWFTALGPDDPQTHFAAGVLLARTFVSEDLERSLGEFERAAALAPNNYLFWLELGRARGRSGDAEGAEQALRRAQSLAPHYSSVQWALGNALLRRGATAEGFAEIRKAVAGDPSLREPAVGLAWQLLDGDIATIKDALGDTAAVNAGLVSALLREKRLEDAFGVWESIPADDRRTTFKDTGTKLYNDLMAAGKHRSAVEVITYVSDDAPQGIKAGSITNGGFEADIKMDNPGVFEWQIGGGIQPQVGVDEERRHGGSRSLVLVFNGGGTDFRTVSQTIAVEPGAQYEFEVYYSSELKSQAGWVWELVDARDGKPVAETQETVAVSDWAPLRTRFTVPAGSEGVRIQLKRTVCTAPVCSVSGRLWFDDASLKKL